MSTVMYVILNNHINIFFISYNNKSTFHYKSMSCTLVKMMIIMDDPIYILYVLYIYMYMYMYMYMYIYIYVYIYIFILTHHCSGPGVSEGSGGDCTPTLCILDIATLSGIVFPSCG